MKIQVIYKIRNVINGKFYVGSTNNVHERFRTHRKKLRSGKHHCAHLQAAWTKYGEDVFKFEVIETVPEGQSLQAAEDVWLAEHVGKEHCYNHGMRSNAPWRGIPKDQHPSFGRPKTTTEREAISATLKEYYSADPTNHPRTGTKHSEETKQKISQNRMGKMAGEEHYRYGKTVSEEVRKKIGDAQRGVKKAPRVYTPEGLEKARANMREHGVIPEKKGFDEVYAKFPQEMRDYYDFTNAVYAGALTRIEGCACPKHGVFSQYAAQIRKGRGCPSCGAEVRGQKKKVEMLGKWADPEERQKMLEARK